MIQLANARQINIRIIGAGSEVVGWEGNASQEYSKKSAIVGAQIQGTGSVSVDDRNRRISHFAAVSLICKWTMSR